MPIHPPGEKFRHNQTLSRRKGKREVAAVLSLTAMVDMFTVLVVFLLQSYKTTGEVIFLPKEITLPKAERIKELKPAVIITLTKKELLLDKTPIISYDKLKAQSDWMVTPLYNQVQNALRTAKQEYDKRIQQRLQKALDVNQNTEDDVLAWNKITIQADKGLDFLTVKKVMYTVSEAGGGEINFAVMKEKSN